MYKKLLLGSILATTLFSFQANAHTLPCRKPMPINTFLELPQGPAFIGLGSNVREEIVKLFIREDTKSWTITISRPGWNGLEMTTCILESGTGWTSMPFGGVLDSPAR